MNETGEKRVHGVSVFTGRELEISIEGGTISRVAELTPSGDAELPFVSPGFFDIQVNGYHGSDYSLDDLSDEHLDSIRRSLAASGTTQHIPTIVTSPRKRLLRNLEVMARACESNSDLASAVPGIHIEGPFISSEDGPRGAHDASYVRDPDYSEFAEWQAASENRICIVTLAPERKGAIAFIERLSSEGVRVAIGHTAATPQQIRRAVQAGASLSTHLGNGSHARIPRLDNYIWEQLAADELRASIIGDGYHLPPAALKVFSRAKGLSRLILVSDAALLGGYDPGVYKWGNIDVEVFPDGHLGLPGTSMLAGAAHLLDWSIAHFHRYTGVPLGEAIRLCTENPARYLGLTSVTSALRVGEPANLTLFRYSGAEDRLQILETIVGGSVVFAAPAPTITESKR